MGSQFRSNCQEDTRLAAISPGIPMLCRSKLPCKSGGNWQKLCSKLMPTKPVNLTAFFSKSPLTEPGSDS